MPTQLYAPPQFFYPADHLTWLTQVPDYPSADGWLLQYAFVIADTQLQLITGAGDITDGTMVDAGGGQWTVTIPSSTNGSQLFGVGIWAYHEYVQKAGPLLRVTLRQGTMDVRRNLDSGSLSAGYDHRSHAKKVLDLLDTMIEGKADADVASYAIAGRSLSRMSPDEILKWRAHYMAIYQRELQVERKARGLENPRRILARF